jgi:hypothetical protein
MSTAPAADAMSSRLEVGLTVNPPAVVTSGFYHARGAAPREGDLVAPVAGGAARLSEKC